MRVVIHEKGFTLIEIIIAVGITVLLASSAVSGFSTFNQNQQVKQAALTLKTNLRLAQSKALSAQKPNVDEVACTRVLSYWVNFVSSPNQGYTVYAKCTEGDISVATITLPPTVWFLTVPSPITFATVTGRTGIASEITLLGTNSGYTLSLSESGQISEDGFVPITPTSVLNPTNTPIPTIPPLASPTPTVIINPPTSTPTAPIVPSPTPTTKVTLPTSTPTVAPTAPIVPSPTPTTATGYSCANSCARKVIGGPYATQQLCFTACSTN